MNRVLICCILLFFAFTSKSQTTWTLQQCIDTALKNNIPVQRDALKTQAAEVGWRQSKSALLPNLSADLSHSLYSGRSIDPSTNNYVSQNTNGASYGIGSDVVLFNGMRLQNSVKQSSFAYQASKMEQQQSKDRLVLDVILAYLSVLSNEDQLSVANQQASTTQATFDRIQILNSQGAVKPSDVSDLKGQLMNDQLNLLTAKNILETSKLTLLQLMNKD
jgi:outer membrane protein